jgi:Neuraminidase (sialidase)
MRMSRIGVTLFGAALLFSSSAFAGGNDNKGSLRLDEKVTVDGTALNPGSYKVEWTGDGPEVKVSILKGGQTVATFPAHVTEQKSTQAADAYASAKQPDGGKTLTAIYFGGKHYSLQVEPGSGNQAAEATK